MDEFFRACSRNRAALWAVIAICLAGCESLGTTKKAYNPVVPPPPRTRHIGKLTDEAAPPTGGGGTVADQASAGTASLASSALSGSQADNDAKPNRRQRRSAPKTDDVQPIDDEVAESSASEIDVAGESELAMPDQTPRKSRAAGGWKSMSPAQKTAQTAARPQSKQSGPDRPASVRPGSVRPASGTRPDADDLTAMKFSSETEGAGQRVKKGEVAATVNGTPIFVDDVLLPMAPMVAQAEKQMPPDVFRQWRRALVAKQLQPHIEQELLLQALKTKLKEDNLTSLKKHIDAEFQKELNDTMKKLKVSTIGELEAQLRKSGSSIEVLQTSFRNKHLAQQYLSSKAMPVDGFDRPDLLEHWKGNPDTYAVAAEVKWRQIHLQCALHGGKPATKKLAQTVCDRLENGEDFATLARELSDGATKSNDGYWDWTKTGSLKSKELDQLLFEMPIGEEIAMLEGPDVIDIVMVLDRHEAGYKAFESVQADIKLELKSNEFKRTVQNLFDDLAEKATIETYTDRL